MEQGAQWRGMISLSDRQLDIVTAGARLLKPEKRDTYLQRIAAMLKLRGRGHSTTPT